MSLLLLRTLFNTLLYIFSMQTGSMSVVPVQRKVSFFSLLVFSQSFSWANFFITYFTAFPKVAFSQLVGLHLFVVMFSIECRSFLLLLFSVSVVFSKF